MWKKYVTRRLATQVAQAWNFGWGKAMYQVYGVFLLNTLVFRDSKKTDYYVDKEQHKKYVLGLYNLLKDDKFIKKFHSEAQSVLECILEEVTKKLNQDLDKLSNKQLSTLYEKFILPLQTQFYIRMWTVFNIGEPLSDVVKDYLHKYIYDEEKLTEYLLSFSSPLEPNDVINERIDILKLAVSQKQIAQQGTDEKIAEHTEKYRHIPMFDFDHNPYTKKYFQSELKLIKKPEKELKELDKLFSKRRYEFKKNIKALKPDRKLKNLLIFLKENVFLRDYRDMIRQKLNLQLNHLYNEIANRLNLNIEQVAILTNEEITNYLRKGDKFPRKEIKQREKTYLLIQKNSNVEIYSGAQAISKAKKELSTDRLEKINKISGVIGSKGKARGSVQIVYTNKDLFKIKKGDIMVATMTRQDFVPAMRKVSAVITDEGSVTAHAAIITRELGIPCIVATKIATQVLKDGDKVEVDANVGIIEIISENCKK